MSALSALDILHLLPQGELHTVRNARTSSGVSERVSGQRATASGQGARASAQGARASGSGQGVEASGHDVDASGASGLVATDAEDAGRGVFWHRRRRRRDDVQRRNWKMGKTGRRFRKAAFRQLRAQSLHHNLMGRARTQDHLFMAVGERLTRASRSTGKRGATWKTHTPEAICKTVFTNPYGTLANKACVSGGSKLYTSHCIQMVANILDAASQKKRSDFKRPLAMSQLASVPSGLVGGGDLRDEFQINNNMFDESQLWIRNVGMGKQRGYRRKKLYRVLASGTQVTRKAPDGPIQDTDLWRSPKVMREYTAASCAGVLAQAHDTAGLHPSGDATPKAKYFASITATDSHTVNKLCSKWISMSQEQEDLLGLVLGQDQPKRYHVTSYCIQHKTGNVVQQVSEYLDLIRPGFALASCFATASIMDKLEFDLRVVLGMQLEVVDPEKTELDAPADQSFLRELFEQAYIRVSPPTNCADSQAWENKRREEAEEILFFFSASNGRVLRHACPPGCCVPGSTVPVADRGASVARAFGLVKRFVAPCISEPAANKYTKVDPVMRRLALAANFFGLLRRALARQFGDDGGSQSDISVDAAIGAPSDATKHWRKVKHIKLNRSFSFLKHRASEYLPLIWLCVCSCIMVVHYKLFRHGTWYNHRTAASGQGSGHWPRCNIFDFTSDLETNPVCEALAALASMLLDPEGAGRRHLNLLFFKFGNSYSEWPQRVREYLEGSLLIAFSVLWRKVYHEFQCYPWLLAPAFDVRRSLIDRRAALQKFLDAQTCCLDKGLCLPLRARHGAADDYCEGTALHDFLEALFQRIVVTSTQCELIFAGLTRLTRNTDEGTGLPSLVARYVVNAYTQQVTRWREDADIRKAEESALSRPPWLFPLAAGSKVNHLHLLMQKRGQFGSMGAAKSDFDALPEAERKGLRQEARVKRDMAVLQPSRLNRVLSADVEDYVGGPLNLASASGPFPLRASAVREALQSRTVDSLAADWRQAHDSYTEPLAGFPSTVPALDVCHGVCNCSLIEEGGDSGDHNETFRPEVNRLFRHLQLACRFASISNKRDPTLLLRLDSTNAMVESVVEFVLVTHHSRPNDSRFEATCVSMKRVGVASASSEGTIVCPATRETLVGLWPGVETERDLLRRLISVSDRWDMSQCINRRVATIPLGRLVTELSPLSYESLLAKETEFNVQAQALKAFRMVMRNAPSRTAPPKRTASGQGRPSRKKGKRMSDEEMQTESSETSDGSEVRDYWNDIVDSILKPHASDSGGASGVAIAAAASGDGSTIPSIRRKGIARRYLPAHGGGGCVHFERYDGGPNGRPYENWILKCPHHEGCEKTRGCGINMTQHYGELEPLAFLHAWRDMTVPPGKKHRHLNPTREQVDAKMAVPGNVAAFADVNAKFRE